MTVYVRWTYLYSSIPNCYSLNCNLGEPIKNLTRVFTCQRVAELEQENRALDRCVRELRARIAELERDNSELIEQLDQEPISSTESDKDTTCLLYSLKVMLYSISLLYCRSVHHIYTL